MADTALTSLLSEDSIRLDCSAVDRFDAVRQCGAALVAAGAVDESYVDAMIQRENTVSTFVGEGVAIPHGTDESRRFVKRTALAILVSHLSVVDLQTELARYPGAIIVESDLPPAVVSAVQEALNEANRPRFSDAPPQP